MLFVEHCSFATARRRDAAAADCFARSGRQFYFAAKSTSEFLGDGHRAVSGVKREVFERCEYALGSVSVPKWGLAGCCFG